uniref:Uncharacterized protein n=1 Tax=Anopheles farauti TaxID=69004 RepID=A0A182QI83_9DIPT
MDHRLLVETLFEAITIGDEEAVEQCIGQATIETVLEFERCYGESPLHLCVKIGGMTHLGVVRCLLASGSFDSIVVDGEGKNVLECAYATGDTAFVEELIKVAIDGLDDATACYKIMRHDSLEIFKMYLSIRRYTEAEEFQHITNALIQLSVKNFPLSDELRIFAQWKLSEYGFRNLSGNWPGSKDPNEWKHHIEIIGDCWRVISEKYNTRLHSDVDDQFLHRLQVLHNHFYFLKHKQSLGYLPLQEAIFCVAIFLSIFRNSTQFHGYRLMVNKCMVIDFVRMVCAQLAIAKRYLENTEGDLLRIAIQIESLGTSNKDQLIERLMDKIVSSSMPNKTHVVKQLEERVKTLTSTNRDGLVKDMMDKTKKIDKKWTEQIMEEIKSLEKTQKDQLMALIGKRLRHVSHPQNVATRLMAEWKKGKPTATIVASIISGEVFNLQHLMRTKDRRIKRKLIKCYIKTKQFYSLHKIVFYCEQINTEREIDEEANAIDVACMKRVVQVLGEAVKNTQNSANMPGKAEHAISTMLTDLFPDMNKSLREVFSHTISLKKVVLGDDRMRKLCQTFSNHMGMVKAAFQLLYVVSVADVCQSFYGTMRQCNSFQRLRSLLRYVGRTEELVERQNACHKQVTKYFHEAKATFAELRELPIGKTPQFAYLQQQMEGKNYRNFLAHDALSYNLLTDSSMEKIVINAFVFSTTDVRLFGNHGNKIADFKFPTAEITHHWVDTQHRLLEQFQAQDVRQMHAIAQAGGETKSNFCNAANMEYCPVELCPLTQFVNPCEPLHPVTEFIERYFVGFKEKRTDAEYQLAMALKLRDYETAFNRTIMCGDRVIREALFSWPDLMTNVRKTNLFVHLAAALNRKRILSKLIEHGNELGVREMLPYFDAFNTTGDRGPLGDAMLYCERSIANLLVHRTAYPHPAILLLAIMLHWHDIFTTMMAKAEIDTHTYKFLLVTTAQARNYTAALYLVESEEYRRYLPGAVEACCTRAARMGELTILQHILGVCTIENSRVLAKVLHEAALKRSWHCVKLLLDRDVPADVLFSKTFLDESCTFFILVKFGQSRLLDRIKTVDRVLFSTVAKHPLAVAIRNAMTSSRMIGTLRRLGFDWLDSSSILHEAIGSSDKTMYAIIKQRLDEYETCPDNRLEHFGLALRILLRWKMISYVEETKYDESTLFFAVRSGGTVMVKELLNWGRSIRSEIDLTDTINFKDYNGETPLHKCFPNDTLEMVKLLVENGANPLLADSSGFAGIHLSLLNSLDYAVGRYLFDECIRRDLRNEKGHSLINLDDGVAGNKLIHIAVSTGRCDIIERLLKHHIDITVMNSVGVTPAHLVAGANMNRPEAIVKMLLEYDPSSIDMLDTKGSTLVHYAVRENNFELLQVILQYKPNLLLRTELTPLGMALLLRYTKVAKRLLDHAIENNIQGITQVDEDDIIVLSLICNDYGLSKGLLEYELQHTDTIQIPLTLAGQFAATVGVSLDQFDGFQGLDSLSGGTAISTAEMRRANAVALTTSVNAADGADAGRAVVVQATQDRGTAHVEPIRVRRRQFLEFGGLDQIDILRNLQLARPVGVSNNSFSITDGFEEHHFHLVLAEHPNQRLAHVHYFLMHIFIHLRKTWIMANGYDETVFRLQGTPRRPILLMPFD